VTSPAAKSSPLVLEIAALATAVVLLVTLQYAPRARRAEALASDLSRIVAENERLGQRLAAQGDVAAENERLREAAARFGRARLEPGRRGETTALLRRIASSNGLAVSKEGAWSGAPLEAAAGTLVRKEISLRGPFASCQAFVAEAESQPEGFVVERLLVRRSAARDGADVLMDVRFLAVESSGSGAR